MEIHNIEAVTVQLRFNVVEDAHTWYSQLLGKEPDHVADENFKEWEVFSNFWLQIVEGEPIIGGARIRFGVRNLEVARKELESNLDIKFDENVIIPGSVALYNFKDPWGNPLGIFQDLIEYPIKENET